ncbi:MAG: ABC transporter permease [Propionibacteriaceae bacterium]|nr:ABC transporter permease [Propionibacteriaceae bacterium]
MSKKSRRLIRSGGQPAPAPAEPEVVPEAPARTFFFLPDSEPVAVEEAELHELMKLWRHGRATRTLGQVISDSYVTVFSVVLVGAMVISTVINAQQGMTGCSTAACDTGRLLVPTAVLFGSWGLGLGLSRLFGPVLASAAEGSWLMDAPISRHRLLRGRLVLPLLLGFFVPALLTGLVAALSGMDWLSVLAWALAAGSGALAQVALAASEQTHERTWLLRLLQGIWAALAVAILALVVSVAAAWLPASAIAGAGTLRGLVFAVAGIAGLVAVWFVVATLRRLELIRRARLVSGGSLVSGMQGAMFALDLGLIRDILVERRSIERGHVRPTRGHGLGLRALIWRDLQRVFRSPGALVPLALSLVVPYAVDALRMSQLNPLLSGLALVITLVPFLGGLRVLTRTGGMARSMPFKTTQLRTAAMAVPAGLAMLWGLAAAPAFIGISGSGADRTIVDGLIAAGITAVAGVLGAVRWVTAKKPDFSAPMMATASGALPPTLLFNLFAGLDMVALVTAPLILGAPPVWSAALAVLVFIVLRGTFNMDDLRSQQEEAQKEMAAAKQARTEKIKVPRPTR